MRLMAEDEALLEVWIQHCTLRAMMSTGHCPGYAMLEMVRSEATRRTSPVVYTRPGAPRISGASKLVPKQ